MFINLKGVERMDYISYITSFDQLYDVPRDRKGGEYRKYLAALLDYLWSFMTRTRPLLDLEVEMAEVLKDFDSKFERGELPGWAREQVGSRFRLSRTVISHSCQVGAMAHSGAHLDLSAFSNSEELATLGLDR